MQTTSACLSKVTYIAFKVGLGDKTVSVFISCTPKLITIEKVFDIVHNHFTLVFYLKARVMSDKHTVNRTHKHMLK